MDSINLCVGDRVLKSDGKQAVKTSITIDNLTANTDYPQGTYKETLSNESGEAYEVGIPAFPTKDIKVASGTLDVERVDLAVGETHNLLATIEPSKTTKATPLVTSEQDDNASRSRSGLIEAKARCPSNITVNTDSRNHTDTVTVVTKDKSPQEATDVTVDHQETPADITA
ncbi:tail protein [Staphylococcus phage vB_SauH_DELF3]|nr:tail protein [Staphylococcus phage vB_SauH_DELF3]